MRLRTLLPLSLLVASSSFAWGPVAEAGANITLLQSATSGGTSVTFNNLVGPVVRVGLELGDRFNHALVFEFTQSSGQGESLGSRVPLTIRTFAGRYTFSVDFLKKEGFTPSVGVGVALGQFTVTESGEKTGVFLAFHAQAGVRYGFKSGFGLRVDVAVSSYGGFLGLQPTAGLSWRF